jgi:ABC transporter substrate binding protein
LTDALTQFMFVPPNLSLNRTGRRAASTWRALTHDARREAATYVDRILKGAHHGDLPIGQARTFELIINLKTAKALGLTISPALLLSADEIIQ